MVSSIESLSINGVGYVSLPRFGYMDSLPWGDENGSVAAVCDVYTAGSHLQGPVAAEGVPFVMEKGSSNPLALVRTRILPLPSWTKMESNS